MARPNAENTDAQLPDSIGESDPERDEEAEVVRRNAWWWAVPVLLAVVLVYLWWNSLGIDRNTPLTAQTDRPQLAGAAIQVPNVVGLTGREAYMKLETSGFKITTVAGESVAVATAFVTAQEPQGGDMARPESVVTIEFGAPTASGSQLGLTDENTVPSVVRESESSAVRKLQAAGYAVTVTRRSGDKAVMRANTVMSQSPAGGTPLAQGRTVSIVVWAGQHESRLIVVPDLIGLPVAKAREKVIDAGFKFEAFERPQYKGGRVANQFPLPGNKLLEGGTVGVSYGE